MPTTLGHLLDNQKTPAPPSPGDGRNEHMKPGLPQSLRDELAAANEAVRQAEAGFLPGERPHGFQGHAPAERSFRGRARLVNVPLPGSGPWAEDSQLSAGR